MERNIGDLAIERGVTGFIVHENSGVGVCGRKLAFETSVALAEFVASWADKDNEVKGGRK